MKTKVYEDENIKLYRQNKDYDIKTKDLSRKIMYGKQNSFSMSFSVGWENVNSSYMFESEYTLAA